jgi:phosphate transport system protein
MSNRRQYDEALAALHRKLNDLGALTATAVDQSLSALAGKDVELARRVIGDDRLIDEAERALESQAITLIATQQPVASDLRRIIAAIAVAGELERIADYAKGISKLVVGAGGATPLEPSATLLELGTASSTILAHALNALAQLDEAAAKALLAEEERIDHIYKPLKLNLSDSLSSSPLGSARAADLLFIAHNLERISDRATNIAERIIYYTSGQLVELNP